MRYEKKKKPVHTDIPKHRKECDGLPASRFNHRVLRGSLSISAYNLCCCEIILMRNMGSFCGRGYVHDGVAISKVTQDVES